LTFPDVDLGSEVRKRGGSDTATESGIGRVYDSALASSAAPCLDAIYALCIARSKGPHSLAGSRSLRRHNVASKVGDGGGEGRTPSLTSVLIPRNAPLAFATCSAALENVEGLSAGGVVALGAVHGPTVARGDLEAGLVSCGGAVGGVDGMRH